MNRRRKIPCWPGKALLSLLLASLPFMPCIVSEAYGAAAASTDAPVAAIAPGQIEADWLRQDDLRNKAVQPKAGPKPNVSPEADAAGAVDGVIDGRWGFHTDNEEDPWWQVDLGKSTPIERIVLYNRCKRSVAGRAARIIVLLSDDGETFQRAYQHDGTTFYGYADKKPLVVELDGKTARYVRIEQPGKNFFHLDEIKIYSAGDKRNMALGCAATQSSTSRWSVPRDYPTGQVIERGLRLAKNLKLLGTDVETHETALREVAGQLQTGSLTPPTCTQRETYMRARWAVRKLALLNPLLDFDEILFVKRAPGMFPHVSDQYYGWWSRGGGGIYILSGFKGDCPRLRCLTEGFEKGNFLRPEISYDGRRVLFAYSKHYRHVAGIRDKTRKEDLPEDAFYHIFEMNLDGTGLRQLTHGHYDDFDARYLPSGDIALLSTRKGTAIQAGRHSAAATTEATRPDSYVRCGGGNHRPVAVFTLHRMNVDGGNLHAISAFESFEWTPAIAQDGRIVYARWDYVDRFNGHFFSLWSTNPDGTKAQLVYGNYTKRPQAVFEARPIPNSRKLVFTASAHHSITGGSLVLLDRTRGTEDDRPVTRLTPEVPFPETEGWPAMYYGGPWPLSETHYLCSWADRPLPKHNYFWNPDDPGNPRNASGIYLYDAFGNLNLLYRDPEISSTNPTAVRPRSKPPVIPDMVEWDGPQEGKFLLQDVYQGLKGVRRGSIARLRIVGVLPKVQPQKNQPVLGVSREETGKFVLGTVPVEEDGSAYFRVPSGVPVFLQAISRDGFAVQTMRSLCYVQPNQTLGCIGCHESREATPQAGRLPLAAARDPSKLTPGPSGTWPLRFAELVQPVLDQHCVSCHRPDSDAPKAARFDLTPAKSYQTLLSYGGKDLQRLVFEKDSSTVGDGPARKSKLLALLSEGNGHEGVQLDADGRRRLIVWMDTYAQRQGSFSHQQEEELRRLRRDMASLLSR